MANSPIGETCTGRVRGLSTSGVRAFRGIPFADPPTGSQRFLPPLPRTPWSGVRACTEFGPVAMQVPGPLETGRGMPTPMDEDCLNLNIWTPGVDDRRRPVLVWIHGGALVNGAGSLAWYDGSSLARSGDLVVVTFNYRLNAFGYLHLGELAPGEPDSGNAGLLDQIAALRWVRENIGAFGGDPDRVCVVGESAGSWSVGTLLAVRSARGLFRSAIMQSGVPSLQSPASATRTAVEVLKELGLDEHEVAQLRRIPPTRLVDAADRVTAAQMARSVLEPDPEASPGFSPVTGGPAGDGGAALIDPAETGAGLPVLIGTTLDEMRIMRALVPDMPPLDEDELERRCDRCFGAAAAEVLSAYQADSPGATADDLWVSIQSDLTFGVPTLDFIDRRQAAGAATWHYRFDWRSPADNGRFGAAHTLEIPFIFDTFDAPGAREFTGGPPEAAHHLARRIREAWISFVRNGSPVTEGLPGWPATTAADPATMIFDDTCRLDHAPKNGTVALRAARRS